MIMNDVVIFVSLESEAADWHGKWALLEASGVSPLEQDGVELPGAEVLITVLVKQRVNHVDHMSIQLLIIICHHYIAIDVCHHILNEKEKRKREICRQIDNYQPVNNDLYCKSVTLRD